MVVNTMSGICGIPYFTLGGFLINYVFRYVMVLSTLQLRLVNCITCYGGRAKVAVSDDEKAMRNKRIARAQRIELVFLFVKCVGGRGRRIGPFHVPCSLVYFNYRVVDMRLYIYSHRPC